MLTGGCLCGAIRFEAEGLPLKPHTCACSICQKHSGAPLIAWVEFSAEMVRWTGTDGPPATYRSSKFSSRAFCKTCGSTIGAIDDAPVIALAVSAFDTPEDPSLAPTKQSYGPRTPTWLKVR